jgi:hypothetical protein
MHSRRHDVPVRGAVTPKAIGDEAARDAPGSVGFRNLVTPRGRTRELHHQIDHDVGPECGSNLSLLEVSAWVA